MGNPVTWTLRESFTVIVAFAVNEDQDQTVQYDPWSTLFALLRL